MHRRVFAVATALSYFAILVGGPLERLAAAADNGDAKGRAAGTDLFGLTKVVAVHLEISADEYRAMQPPAPAAFGAPPPAPRPRRPGERPGERNLFGVEFSWARGSVTVLGKTYKGVGLRYSGNASYMASAGGLKRSLLVDLEASGKEDFHGLRAILLQSGALDPTKAREALAFALFREAGVPAPRTVMAEVTLTVPGQYEKAYLGLYTLVEPVDRAFAQGPLPHGQGAPGQAARPSRPRLPGRGLGEIPGPVPAAGGTEPGRSPALDRVRPPRSAGHDEKFRKEIASYLDVDRFLRFMAVQAMIANADGFFTLGYNYSLFLDPNTNRFVFIPGDQELSFANFAMMGSADQLMDMSLARPYGGENRLADRLLAIKEMREAHQKILKDLATTVFRKDRLLADAAAIEGATKAIIAKEAEARAERAEPPVGFGPPGAPTAPDLRTFAEKRTASIADQIAGKKNGYRPQFNFGPPGGNRPLQADGRQDDRRGRQGSARVQGQPLRGAAEGRIPGDAVGGAGRRGVRGRGRARVARPHARRRPGRALHRRRTATARPTA